MSQLHLMRALKFDSDDLRANRDGHLSDGQREHYAPPKLSPVVILAVMGHLVVVGGLLGVLAIVTGAKALWLVFGLVVLMMMAPFGMMQEVGRLRPILRDDINKGRVEKVCGIAILQEKTGRGIYYELIIGGVVLEISLAEAAGFRNEGTYCVYYLPGSKTLLTAEASD